MTSVLAPALLQYVERSRAQKDDSAMGELTNAIMLALSDQDIYDEVLCYACTNNVSCYIDTSTVPDGVQKVPTKGPQDNPEAWEYDDNQRRNDEVAYYAAGKMRGVTITFYPDRSTNTSQFTLANGQINAFARPTDAPATGGTIQFVETEKPSNMKYYGKAQLILN